MEVITSTSNVQVKQLIQLQKKAKERSAQDVFVAEGPKMYLEAPPAERLRTYASETFYRKNERLFGENRSLQVLSDRVFESVSDTRTPQGVLCIVRQKHYDRRELLGAEYAEKACPAGMKNTEEKSLRKQNKLPQSALLLALENLQDPGNLGTMIRTAEGAGVTGILLGEGCADIYNPKVIRSTMGAIYRMPFFRSENLRQDLRLFQAEGVRLYAAYLKGSVNYDEERYCGPSGFLIGNESQGLTEETAALADARIRIPMCGQVESLNAAVAASVLMYEANRQRRKARDRER